MTDVSTPGEVNAAADNKSTAHAISKAGGHAGYVVDGVDIAQFYPEITTANLLGFSEASRTGLDITLNGGEAFVFGWLCRDRTTTITLPASSLVTICVGFNPDAVLTTGQAPTASDNIILDVESAFGNGAPKLPLYEVDTAASTIRSVTDIRPMGPSNADSSMFASRNHQESTTNPHNVTTAQLGAFPTSGGTVTGPVTVSYNGTNAITVDPPDESVSVRFGSYHGGATTDLDRFELTPYVAGTYLWGDILSYYYENKQLRLARQGATTIFGGDVMKGSNHLVESSTKEYDIQKNGTDGVGIINFKT